jgi:hypothetical protein
VWLRVIGVASRPFFLFIAKSVESLDRGEEICAAPAPEASICHSWENREGVRCAAVARLCAVYRLRRPSTTGAEHSRAASSVYPLCMRFGPPPPHNRNKCRSHPLAHGSSAPRTPCLRRPTTVTYSDEKQSRCPVVSKPASLRPSARGCPRSSYSCTFRGKHCNSDTWSN